MLAVHNISKSITKKEILNAGLLPFRYTRIEQKISGQRLTILKDEEFLVVYVAGIINDNIGEIINFAWNDGLTYYFSRMNCTALVAHLFSNEETSFKTRAIDDDIYALVVLDHLKDGRYRSPDATLLHSMAISIPPIIGIYEASEARVAIDTLNAVPVILRDQHFPFLDTALQIS